MDISSGPRCPACQSALYRSPTPPGRIMICTGCEKEFVVISKGGQAQILEKCVSESEAKAAVQKHPLQARMARGKEEAANAKKIATAQRTRASGIAIVVATAIIALPALFLQPADSPHAIILEYTALRFIIVSTLAILLFSEQYRSAGAEQKYSLMFQEVRRIYFLLLEEYYARLAGTSILDEGPDDNFPRQYQSHSVPQQS